MKPLAALLLLALGVILAAQAPPEVFAPDPEKAWAVVIGVSRYQVLPKAKWLEFADADADSFARFLASGQGLRFLPDHVVSLTNEQATRAEVMRSIGTWLLRKTRPGDSVYIFLAMHGDVEPLGPRDAYLVAHDSSLEDLLTTGVSFPQLQDMIQRRLSKAARVLVLTDACRAGKLAGARAFQEKVMEMKGSDIYGLLASGPDENSAEGAMFGGGHGAFTYYLLRGLQGEADANRNGFVEISEASHFVREYVPKALYGRQNPQSFGPPRDLALSNVREERADLGFSAGAAPSLATLVIGGPPRTEVSIDGVTRGVISDSGSLSVAGLTADNHNLMLVTARGERVVQQIQVSADPTEVEFSRGIWVRVARARGLGPADAPELMRRFRQALAANRLLPPAGENALDLLRQVIAASNIAAEDIEDARARLASALESEGQQVLLAYLRGEAVPLGAEDFERGATLFGAAAGLSPLPDPLLARQAFCAGRARLYRGQGAEAMPLLREATRLEPRAAYAYNALGIAALQQRQYGEALRQFQAAAERAPRWAYPHFNQALAYTAMEQYARAEEAYRQAIQRGPEYAYLHYSLASLYMKINQPARAEQEYRRALELDLDAAAGHNMLGVFFRTRRRDREAETAFRRALEFHVGDVPARLNLARLYRDQRRHRQAESELLEAARRIEAAAIRAALGDLYLEMRRPGEAAAQYRQAAALASDAAERAALEEKARKAERR